MANKRVKEEPEILTSMSLTEYDRAWLLRYGGIKRGVEYLIRQDRQRCQTKWAKQEVKQIKKTGGK